MVLFCRFTTSELTCQDGVPACLTESMVRANGQEQQKAAGILLYFWWNIWKEHMRDHVQQNEFHVATTTKEEIDPFLDG
jgi:hypothetical protein